MEKFNNINKKIELTPEYIEQINNKFSQEIVNLSEKFAQKYVLFLESFEGKFDSQKLKEGGYLGYGGAGTVFSINDDICLKVMDNRPNADNFNFYDLEAYTAKELNGLKIDGIRMPTFFSYYRTEHNREILMEKVIGVNFQEIFNGDEKLPQKFIEKYFIDNELNIDLIEDKLNDFFEAMHDKNIFHGDIALRNIMVDKEGEFVVIDTGRAGFLNNDNKKEKIENDYKMLDELIEKLEEFSQDKNNSTILDPVVHFNSNEDNKIENQIFDDRILKLAKDFVKKSGEINGIKEFLKGLYVSKKSESLLLGLKAVIVDNEVYYIGFKKD